MADEEKPWGVRTSKGIWRRNHTRGKLYRYATVDKAMGGRMSKDDIVARIPSDVPEFE